MQPSVCSAGFPTGLGALIARKESLSVLHKVYFGGGSVLDATAEDVWRLLSPAPTGFEDGTRDFLGITQLQFGFKQLQQLGGIKVGPGWNPAACQLCGMGCVVWEFGGSQAGYRSTGEPLNRNAEWLLMPRRASTALSMLSFMSLGGCMLSWQPGIHPVMHYG
jgi:hypothetical protein